MAHRKSHSRVLIDLCDGYRHCSGVKLVCTDKNLVGIRTFIGMQAYLTDLCCDEKILALHSAGKVCSEHSRSSSRAGDFHLFYRCGYLG